MLEFINPALLYGAAAGIIPIIIHLLMRRRPRPTPFPAIRFLQSSFRESVKKFRLKHLILLILRILILTLFAVALARPVAKSRLFAQPGKVQTNAVIILDDSYSMAYRERGRCRFDLAREGALRLLDSLSLGSKAAVLLTSHSFPQASLSLDLDALKEKIRQAKVSQCARSAGEALAVAIALFEELEGPKEIFLFTDLTRSSLPAVGRLKEKIKDLGRAKHGPPFGRQTADGELLSIYIVDVGSETNNNFFIGEFRGLKTRVSRNSLLRLEGQVSSANRGAEKIVELYLDGEKRGERVLSLRANSRVPFQFDISFPEEGVKTGWVALAGADPLSLDDKRYFTIQVSEPTKVLLVSDARQGPSQEGAFFLKTALAPPGLGERYGVVVHHIPPLRLNASSLQDYQAVFLVDVAKFKQGSSCDLLKSYVSQGGGVAVFPGPRIVLEEYGHSACQALLGVKIKGLSTSKEGVSLHFRDFTHPFTRPFDQGRLGDVSAARFKKFLELELPAERRFLSILAYFSTGQPAIIENPLGQGRVLLFAFPIGDLWGDLPAHPVFVPLMHETLKILIREEKAVPYTIGEEVLLNITREEAAGKVLVKPPQGDEVELTPDTISLTALLPQTSTAGNYLISLFTPDGKKERGFAVNLNVRESELLRITEEELEGILPGSRPLTVRRSSLTVNDERRTLNVHSAPAKREIYDFVILTLLIIASVETFFANLFYLRRAPVSGGRGQKDKKT